MIDSLYDELKIYWQQFTYRNFRFCHFSDPTKMRSFMKLPDRNNKGGTDHLLFWPIGQQMD